MIPQDKEQRVKMLKYMLEGLNKAFDTDTTIVNATAWELDFLSSVIDQFNSKGDLSIKQADIVEKLYDKYCN